MLNLKLFIKAECDVKRWIYVNTLIQEICCAKIFIKGLEYYYYRQPTKLPAGNVFCSWGGGGVPHVTTVYLFKLVHRGKRALGLRLKCLVIFSSLLKNDCNIDQNEWTVS